MHINSDFSRWAVVKPDQYHWTASPQHGVDRVMLDRIGEEKARATSIVRYACDSQFPPHKHPGGEEILVLSGTFSDEENDFPAGWYLRNPPGSAHRPSSNEGAVIFVKLWQMPATETRTVRVNTGDPSSWHVRGDRSSCLLFDDANERVSMERLDAYANLFSEPVNGAEILVVRGELWDETETYIRGSWLRVPTGVLPKLSAGPGGATVYLKTGHLTQDSMQGMKPC